MGATRRLDHYDASLGWQGLFIVAGIGALLVLLGFLCQIVQLVVSIKDREKNRVGNDPWDGRTLEWSTTSPAPLYNFARIPEVRERDAFWVAKQNKEKRPSVYEEIMVPKNTGAAAIISAFVFLFGVGIVWHIWWLAAFGLAAAVAGVFLRGFD